GELSAGHKARPWARADASFPRRRGSQARKPGERAGEDATPVGAGLADVCPKPSALAARARLQRLACAPVSQEQPRYRVFRRRAVIRTFATTLVEVAAYEPPARTADPLASHRDRDRSKILAAPRPKPAPASVRACRERKTPMVA